MTVSAGAYRDALRHFPSGVTVVTIRTGERVHGLTVSAFASVSPDPPLVAILIDHQHGAHSMLEEPDASFAVNILGADQREISERFAWSPEDQRFGLDRWSTATTGAPILEDAVAWLDCTIHSRLAAGSHTLYIGRVEASATPRPADPPLVYWNREYRRLAEPDA
jgi:flavin reductase (DIM6/NTAB) family NADH-FMN oxidoreductase RutF